MRPSHFLALLLTACAAETPDPTEDPRLEAWWNAPPPPPAACAPGSAAEINGVPYNDVQAALNASQPYDTVFICPGTWAGGFVLSHAGPVAIEGATGNPADVILSGRGVQRVLSAASNGVTLRLGRVTLQDGSALGGAALYIEGRAHVHDAAFLNHDSGFVSGGAIEAYTRHLRIERSYFEGCVTGADGGAIAVDDIVQPNQRIEISDSHFVGNISDNNGGAISMVFVTSPLSPTAERTVSIRRSTFHDNHSAYTGGAGYVAGRRADLRFEDLYFEQNSSELYSGGAVGFEIRDGDVNVDIIDSVAINNSAARFGSAYHFGRLNWTRDRPSRMRIQRGAILQNQCPPGLEDYGAVSAYHPLVTLQLDDVDFGTGADDNACWDLIDCPVDYGTNTSGQLDLNSSVDCL